MNDQRVVPTLISKPQHRNWLFSALGFWDKNTGICAGYQDLGIYAKKGSFCVVVMRLAWTAGDAFAAR